jgi:hypothetical protein
VSMLCTLMSDFRSNFICFKTRTRSWYEAVQLSAAFFALRRMHVLRTGTLGKAFFCVCRRDEPYVSQEDLSIYWVIDKTAGHTELPSDDDKKPNWTLHLSTSASSLDNC